MSQIKVIITTSLRPSRRTRTFTKELSQLIPGALRITRGKLNFQALHALSVDMGAEKLIVVDSSMGNPSRMVVYAARPSGFEKVCEVRFAGVALIREMKRGLRMRESPSLKTPSFRGLCVNYEEVISAERSGAACRESVECLLKAFGAVISQKCSNGVLIKIEPVGAGIIKVHFRESSNNEFAGPSLKILCGERSNAV